VCMDNDSFGILHAAAPDDEIKANGHSVLLSTLVFSTPALMKHEYPNPQHYFLCVESGRWSS